MTKGEAAHLSDVLKAYSEDKEIEHYLCNVDSWMLYNNTTFNDTNVYNYRIKPKPKYRPYKNAEEFLQAQEKHKMTVKDENCWFNIASFNNDGVYLSIGKSYDYSQIVDMFVWADDGSPCGIID